MHFTTLLTGLTAFLSVTTAIPMASERPTPTPSVSTPLISPTPSGSASASASPSSTPNPYEAYTCPKDKFKSCCMSVQQTGKDVAKSLGELVPILGGLQVSSSLSFQCKKMPEREAPGTCHGHGYSPMCCDNKGDGTLNACKPFGQVKKNYYSHQGQSSETQADMIMDTLT
ncbi:hypothetical protein N7457_001801 [Penicillium paradoxum]|uniref:uncharacterized protein n=1 Tax=Penicillium paradoxum TaxID=176176 RepID=UPI0025498C1D|nr:uncharacterized protein N7457_001801 [Penicillium paradoxum]KAJ5795202.1 hypothetical protein N7457_001801 [Penicillium paradoxum]